MEALDEYRRIRDRRWPEARSTSFFVSTVGTRLIHQNVDKTFRTLLDPAGITWPAQRRRPRLHDLRHRFAVETLIGWYQAGVDVDAHLPLLSTFLGHSDPSHTYWYVSASPQLLALAAQRRQHAQEVRP